jgi:hypothetical protein
MVAAFIKHANPPVSAAGIANVMTVFLQTPESHGGYGLNAKENSNCTLP